MEKGNSWDSATRIISAVSADYVNCPTSWKWVPSSPPKNQLLPFHPSTQVPPPLPGNNRQSWPCRTHISMKVSLERIYQGLQYPPPFRHGNHMVLNMFCITLSGAAVPQVCSPPLSHQPVLLPLQHHSWLLHRCPGALWHIKSKSIEASEPKMMLEAQVKRLGSLCGENGVQATENPMGHILSEYVAHPFSRP